MHKLDSLNKDDDEDENATLCVRGKMIAYKVSHRVSGPSTE